MKQAPIGPPGCLFPQTTAPGAIPQLPKAKSRGLHVVALGDRPYRQGCAGRRIPPHPRLLAGKHERRLRGDCGRSGCPQTVQAIALQTLLRRYMNP